MDKDFPIKGWKWIFYIIGLLTGFFNLTFWFLQLFRHLTRTKDKEFFGKEFHLVTFYWGIFSSVLIVLGLLILFGIVIILGTLG